VAIVVLSWLVGAARRRQWMAVGLQLAHTASIRACDR